MDLRHVEPFAHAQTLTSVFAVHAQEVLGVKDLTRLSNEQIDGVSAELKRLSSASATRSDGGELSTLLYDLLIDSASCRKRLNDYTEGLLVQTAQKLDGFKGAFTAARGGVAP